MSNNNKNQEKGQQQQQQQSPPCNVLAEGESTGHKHRLVLVQPELAPPEQQFIQVYENPSNPNVLYFQVGAGQQVALVHEEHHRKLFNEGIYRVDRQQGYDYLTNEIKPIMD